jgi:GGDEF domain-containing protein
MREILHADLLVGATTPAEPRGATEVRGRMELAHEEALRERTPLAVLRVAVDGIESVARIASGGKNELVLATLTTVVRGLARPGDLLAVREQDHAVLVLTQTDAAAAEVFARALQEAVRRISLPHSSIPLGIRLSIGLAHAQFDAPYWFQTLLAVANEGVEVAQNSGGGRIVHTELYGFHQRRLERLSPDRPKPTMPPPVKKPEVNPAYLRHAPAPAAAAPAVSPGAPATPRPAAAPLPSRSARAESGAPPAGIAELEERVLRLAREWTEEALSKALAETQRVHTSEVDVLERRIQKLTRALEDAQSDLVRAHAGHEIDPGVASAFRTVQGLRDQHGPKRDMLEKLFQANLELRTLLGQQG